MGLGRLGAVTCVWLWGKKRRRFRARVGPGGRFLYLSSSSFQSCHHLRLPVLGKASTHLGLLSGLQALPPTNRSCSLGSRPAGLWAVLP